MKLNCLIVDDEPIARQLLEEYIDDINFLNLVGAAENPLKANNQLLTTSVDLLFLDINMPKMSGIDFLRSNPHLPMTIVTTAYPEYALDGFELEVIDYLVKPISSDRFLRACLKAKEFYELKKNRSNHTPGQQLYFYVRHNGKFEKIHFDELLYVEALQNYVVLHTSDDRKLVVYLTMKAVHEQLPGEVFIKVHKSTIVNSSKIKSIEGNTIYLGKHTLTISQNLYEQVLTSVVRDNLLKRE